MTGDQHPVIRTPDQRIRVFVSSTLRELADERARRARRDRADAARPGDVRARRAPAPAPRAVSLLPRSRATSSSASTGRATAGSRPTRRSPASRTSTTSRPRDAEAHLHQGIRPPRRAAAGAHRAHPHRRHRRLPAVRDGRRARRSGRRRSRDAARRAVRRVARDEPSTRRPTSRRRAECPVPYTATIGREDGSRAVRELLASGAHRVVSLIGPGGIGKSRLAIEIALGLDGPLPRRHLLRAARGRARARAARCRRSPPPSASATTAKPRSTSASRMRSGDGACSSSSTISSRSSRPPRCSCSCTPSRRWRRFLVTSRIVLRIRGEQVYEVAAADDSGPGGSRRASNRAHATRRRCGCSSTARRRSSRGSTSPRRTPPPSPDICRRSRPPSGDRARGRADPPAHPARHRPAARAEPAAADRRRRATCPSGSARCGRRSSGASVCSPDATATCSRTSACSRRGFTPRRRRSARRRALLGRAGDRRASPRSSTARSSSRPTSTARPCSRCSRSCASTRSGGSSERGDADRGAGGARRLLPRLASDASRPQLRGAGQADAVASSASSCRTCAPRSATSSTPTASTTPRDFAWSLLIYWWIAGFFAEVRRVDAGAARQGAAAQRSARGRSPRFFVLWGEMWQHPSDRVVAGSTSACACSPRAATTMLLGDGDRRDAPRRACSSPSSTRMPRPTSCATARGDSARPRQHAGARRSPRSSLGRLALARAASSTRPSRIFDRALGDRRAPATTCFTHSSRATCSRDCNFIRGDEASRRARPASSVAPAVGPAPLRRGHGVRPRGHVRGRRGARRRLARRRARRRGRAIRQRTGHLRRRRRFRCTRRSSPRCASAIPRAWPPARAPARS